MRCDSPSNGDTIGHVEVFRVKFSASTTRSWANGSLLLLLLCRVISVMLMLAEAKWLESVSLCVTAAADNRSMSASLNVKWDPFKRPISSYMALKWYWKITRTTRTAITHLEQWVRRKSQNMAIDSYIRRSGAEAINLDFIWSNCKAMFLRLNKVLHYFIC